MTGMKITLDAAMRARDVSRPTPDQEAAAASKEPTRLTVRGLGGRMRVRRRSRPGWRRGAPDASGDAPSAGARDDQGTGGNVPESS